MKTKARVIFEDECTSLGNWWKSGPKSVII